jgi:hypothetical protein
MDESGRAIPRTRPGRPLARTDEGRWANPALTRSMVQSVRTTVTPGLPAHLTLHDLGAHRAAPRAAPQSEAVVEAAAPDRRRPPTRPVGPWSAERLDRRGRATRRAQNRRSGANSTAHLAHTAMSLSHCGGARATRPSSGARSPLSAARSAGARRSIRRASCRTISAAVTRWIAWCRSAAPTTGCSRPIGARALSRARGRARVRHALTHVGPAELAAALWSGWPAPWAGGELITMNDGGDAMSRISIHGVTRSPTQGLRRENRVCRLTNSDTSVEAQDSYGKSYAR